MGERSVENLEWSLPVPSVQELVNLQRLHCSSEAISVPPRYLRDDLQEIGPTDPSLSLTLPCIDMAKLSDPDSHPSELQKLHSACADWGLFQVLNHGVSKEGMRKMKENVEGFFELPYQEKRKWEQRPGSLEGYGQAFVRSEHQRLQWNDMIFLKCLPPGATNPDLWPLKPTHFREALRAYSEEMRDLAVALVEYIGKGLLSESTPSLESQEKTVLPAGAEDAQFLASFREGRYEVRMNYYPPCPEPERVLGILPHADISGITLLMECGDVPGLQVLKDGHWVLVPVIPGAIVVNLGQIMEVYSNGTYKAPEHRAVVSSEKERVSVATFCYPAPSVPISPSPKLLSKSGLPPLYQTVSLSEYYNRFLSCNLDRVPFIQSLKL